MLLFNTSLLNSKTSTAKPLMPKHLIRRLFKEINLIDAGGHSFHSQDMGGDEQTN